MRDTVTVFVPGSTSNVGPGFDCLGIAFTGKGDRITAHRVAMPGVRVRSVSDPRIPLESERNTAAIAASAVLRRAKAPAGIELTIEKGLPLAGGMGGSAASAVGGAVAANALLGTRLSQPDLLEAALEAEAVVAGRHADNIAPSLYGGAVVIGSLDPLTFASIKVNASIRMVLVTPSYGVETAKARAVLPTEISRADAISQASSLALLVLGLERGDGELIRRSTIDRIAEPARRSLYPGYPEAREAGLAAGALAVVVSGAGPTIVALVISGGERAVASALEGAYRGLGIEAQSHCAEVDAGGARLLS